MSLLQSLETFFRPPLSLATGDGLIVAFSGGADSTALLWGLTRLAAHRGAWLAAAHLDHGLDPGSSGRAAAAAAIAARLGVPFVGERRDVPALRRTGESPEAAARRVRYEFLEEVRRDRGAAYIATGHHRDDQAETVLLRLLFGSGIEGLAGVRPVRGALVRPLLGLPRAALREAVEAAGLPVVEDPTNAWMRTPRNRVRHALLPALAGRYPDLGPDLGLRLARLAEAARRAGAVLDRRLTAEIGLCELKDDDEGDGGDGGVAVDRRALAALPAPLLPMALAALHRRAGAPYPAGGPARTELLRQLGASPGGEGVACDCGGGWRWSVEGSLLALRRAPERERMADFTYTLEIPGELEIPELSVRVGLHHRPVEPWMFTGAPHRAGLVLPLVPGDRVMVRNRRPGDRLHPLGSNGSRRLKEVLVDRRVPRTRRARIPLLCVGERIAWVPGITIDHRFRIRTEATAWVATLTSMRPEPR
jgi:tRNA(Ile)-lysidine synthase